MIILSSSSNVVVLFCPGNLFRSSGAVILQYNWSVVRLLASPPIRLMFSDQPFETLAQIIQIKHIYYTVKVGILFRYRYDTRIDLPEEIINSPCLPMLLSSCLSLDQTIFSRILYSSLSCTSPVPIPLPSNVARWQIIKSLLPFHASAFGYNNIY
jgi:hypothetical protein